MLQTRTKCSEGDVPVQPPAQPAQRVKESQTVRGGRATQLSEAGSAGAITNVSLTI